MPTEANDAKEEVKTPKRSEGRRKKQIRARDSQTDDELLSENEQHDHDFLMCNTKLADKKRLTKCYRFSLKYSLWKNLQSSEKEKEALEASLKLTQAEVEKLKTEASAADT